MIKEKVILLKREIEKAINFMNDSRNIKKPIPKKKRKLNSSFFNNFNVAKQSKKKKEDYSSKGKVRKEPRTF